MGYQGIRGTKQAAVDRHDQLISSESCRSYLPYQKVAKFKSTHPPKIWDEFIQGVTCRLALKPVVPLGFYLLE